MALNVVAPTIVCTLTHRLLPSQSRPANAASAGGRKSKSVRCMTSTLTKPCDQTIVRRSANYKPPVWEYDYLQSLSSDYVGETYTRQAAELKEDVRMMLEKVEPILEKLELVDSVQRLGISYHFETEIKRILDSIHSNTVGRSDWCSEGDLYATALHFRLLRQHGYFVPQDVFNSFKDKLGNFEASLCEDTLGMLYLYEASYLLMGGEIILEEARDFTTNHLKENVKDCTNSNLAFLVSHALELPLHWRIPRMEARWFIPVYEKRLDMNPTLLEFAKLDYNMVQAIHQEDLKHASRWWESTGWGKNLSFVRERLMEAFIWTVGEIFEPQFDYYRRMATRVNALITAIDDVYDVYATLDELHQFTDAIERWDVNAVEQLPDYMKICFYGLFNTVNEMAYESLKDHQGFNVLPYLKKAWVDILKCYLKEATWYHSGYIPTLEEYLENGWRTLGSTLMLVHGYFLCTNSITKETLDCLENYHDIIKWPSIVLRLVNDLGTSSDEIKRGDNPKTIQVFMNETGKSEEEAREHINYLINEGWKKINETRFGNSPFDRTFIEIATNTGRFGHFLYLYGDGHGHDVGKPEIKDCMSSLVVDPIPLN